jgi:hypothetical protein
MRWLRRLLLLGLLGGGGFALYQARSKRQLAPTPAAGAAEWPPLVVADAPVPPTTFAAVPPDAADDHETVSERATWLSPVDGACPEGYPIKANDNSGIFHVPGGRFYARTIPERCYANAADAERDGYRPAKA